MDLVVFGRFFGHIQGEWEPPGSRISQQAKIWIKANWFYFPPAPPNKGFSHEPKPKHHNGPTKKANS